jgi:undecaprenyl-diphosphatase
VDIIQAITLGVVQGLTEFLPVSSTAHLALTPWLFGWKDPGMTFDVSLHIGTLVAVTAYFRKDLAQMLVSWFATFKGVNQEDPYQRLSWLVIFGCVPAVIAGVLLDDLVEHVFRSPYVIAFMLIAVALLIAYAERTTKLTRGWKDIKLKDALLIGLAQAVALIPGTSRSGATMTMALFLGIERADAARFSFLLGYPVIVGSVVFKMKDVLHDATLAAQLPMMGVGIVASAVSGYICIAYLLKFLGSNTMTVFVVYRIMLGIAIIGLIWAGFSPAFHVG